MVFHAIDPVDFETEVPHVKVTVTPTVFKVSVIRDTRKEAQSVLVAGNLDTRSVIGNAMESQKSRTLSFVRLLKHNENPRQIFVEMCHKFEEHFDISDAIDPFDAYVEDDSGIEHPDNAVEEIHIDREPHEVNLTTSNEHYDGTDC